MIKRITLAAVFFLISAPSFAQDQVQENAFRIINSVTKDESGKGIYSLDKDFGLLDSSAARTRFFIFRALSCMHTYNFTAKNEAYADDRDQVKLDRERAAIFGFIAMSNHPDFALTAKGGGKLTLPLLERLMKKSVFSVSKFSFDPFLGPKLLAMLEKHRKEQVADYRIAAHDFNLMATKDFERCRTLVILNKDIFEAIKKDKPAELALIREKLDDPDQVIGFSGNKLLKFKDAFEFSETIFAPIFAQRDANKEQERKAEYKKKFSNSGKLSIGKRLAFLHWPKVIFDFDLEFHKNDHPKLRKAEKELAQILETDTEKTAFLEVNACHHYFIVAGLRKPSRKNEYFNKAAFYKAMALNLHPYILNDKSLSGTNFSALPNVAIQGIIDTIDMVGTSSVISPEVQLLLDMDATRPIDTVHDAVIPYCERFMNEGAEIFLKAPQNLVDFFLEQFQNGYYPGYLGNLAISRNVYFEQLEKLNASRKKRQERKECANFESMGLEESFEAILKYGCGT